MTVQEAIHLAVQQHRAGKLSEAEGLYRRVLAQQPNHPDALHRLGVLAHQVGRHDVAVELIQKAIINYSRADDFYANLSLPLAALGKVDQAMEACRQATLLRPESPAYTSLAVALRDMQQWDAAIHCARQGVALRPHDAQAHNILGYVLFGMARYAEAEAAFAQMLRLNPRSPAAHNNLGMALYSLRKLDASIAAFEQALAIQPDYPDAQNNLGNAYAYLGKYEAAIPLFEKALAQRPDYPAAHWNLGLALMITGDFSRGWRECEWRWRVGDFYLRRNLAQPLWDGSGLDGKRILLYSEQGIGDAIQFVRYVAMVAKKNGRISVICQPELIGLFGQIKDVDQWTVPGEPIPPHDVHCSLLSLPMVFETTLKNIPGDVPYLSADPARVAAWQQRVPGDGRMKVGLTWAGRPGHDKDLNRSFLLATLAPLREAPNVWFCSLQKGPAAEQTKSPPMELADWTDELKDFADTAALVANLDLIITADTAVAHLAGAMGKPVWVLLPFAPDWRWLLDRADTPWYPTMRLFRQKQSGDWSDPVGQVVEALRFL